MQKGRQTEGGHSKSLNLLHFPQPHQTGGIWASGKQPGWMKISTALFLSNHLSSISWGNMREGTVKMVHLIKPALDFLKPAQGAPEESEREWSPWVKRLRNLCKSNLQTLLVIVTGEWARKTLGDNLSKEANLAFQEKQTIFIADGKIQASGQKSNFGNHDLTPRIWKLPST